MSSANNNYVLRRYLLYFFMLRGIIQNMYTHNTICLAGMR